MTLHRHSWRQFAPLHWLQALRGKSVLFTPDEARAILEPSGAIADLCALHGHAPHYTLTLQDTNPRPVTCGCGAVTYPNA